MCMCCKYSLPICGPQSVLPPHLSLLFSYILLDQILLIFHFIYIIISLLVILFLLDGFEKSRAYCYIWKTQVFPYYVGKPQFLPFVSALLPQNTSGQQMCIGFPSQQGILFDTSCVSYILTSF